MPVAGQTDTILFDLTVFGSDTVAVAKIRDPDGVVTTLTASWVPIPDHPELNRSRWTADVLYDQPGVWWVTPTVTAGTGIGRAPAPYPVSVAPAGPGVDDRHTYATTAHLANLMGEAVPVDADRRLRDATARVDGMLKSAVYPVDDDGMPTEQQHILALRAATCAMVKWWDDNGWDGSGAEGQVQSASIAGVSLGFARGSGAAAGRVDLDGDAARDALDQAGLLGHAPMVY
jgi:hypothetical protein